MLEQVTTFEETKAFSCSVLMLRISDVNLNSKSGIQAFHLILCGVKIMHIYSYVDCLLPQSQFRPKN